MISARSFDFPILVSARACNVQLVYCRTAAQELPHMTRIKRLFAGTVRVHYGTMRFLGGEEELAGGNECFEGHVNGVCGAAMRTSLVLRTGLHTGGVKVTADFWDKEPPL